MIVESVSVPAASSVISATRDSPAAPRRCGGTEPATSKSPLSVPSYAGLSSAAICMALPTRRTFEPGHAAAGPVADAVAPGLELRGRAGVQGRALDRRLVQHRAAADVRALSRHVILRHRELGRELWHAQPRRQVPQIDAVGAAAQIEGERAAGRGERDESLRRARAAVRRRAGVERDPATGEAAGRSDVPRLIARSRDRAAPET